MEMMSSTDTAFKLFDKDKDGFITRAEFAKVVIFIYIHDKHGVGSKCITCKHILIIWLQLYKILTEEDVFLGGFVVEL